MINKIIDINEIVNNLYFNFFKQIEYCCEKKKMNEIFEKIFNGNSINSKTKSIKYKNVDGIKYISTKDILKSCVISKNVDTFIPSCDWKKFKIAKNNSILFCIEGGSFAKKFAIVEEDVFFGNKLACLSTKNKDISEYFFYYFKSPNFIKIINDESSSKMIQGISIEKLRNLEILVPKKEHIKAILKKLKLFDKSIKNIINLNIKYSENIDYINDLLIMSCFKKIMKVSGRKKKIYELVKVNAKPKGMINHVSTFKYKGISASDLKKYKCDCGDIRLISTGNNDGFSVINDNIKNFVLNEEAIFIPSGGSANLKYYKGKFISSLNYIFIKKQNNINLKYLYYYMLMEKKYIENCFRGQSIKHPEMKKILIMNINMPSIKKQNSIVEKIDKILLLFNQL